MKLKLHTAFEHWNIYSNIWVFSDPHFNDPESKLMNPNWPDAEDIVKAINSKVSKTDLLIILGDLGDESFVKKLKGARKVLITGNHDKGASAYRRNRYSKEVPFDSTKENMGPDFHHFTMGTVTKLISRDENGNSTYEAIPTKMAVYDNCLFDEVYDGPIFINPKLLLSHEPIKLPFGINCHGHCHQKEQVIYTAEESVMINVCSDVRNFEPVRLDKLIEGYKTKDIHRLTINKAIERKCPINDLNAKYCNKEHCE